MQDCLPTLTAMEQTGTFRLVSVDELNPIQTCAEHPIQTQTEPRLEYSHSGPAHYETTVLTTDSQQFFPLKHAVSSNLLIPKSA